VASKKLTIAYLYLENAHFKKNEFPKAETYYKKAIKKNPKMQMPIIILHGFITIGVKTSVKEKG